MKVYKISSKTLLIIPINDESTKIIEEDNIFIEHNNAMTIIDYNCKIHGSSYLGRFESSKLLLGINNKLPIIIEESNDFIFFPTNSSRNSNCCWIAYNNIGNYIEFRNKVLITFKNEQQFPINISYNSFEKQIVKTNKLIMINKFQKNLIK